MEFEGLTQDDLANVSALNRRWLRLLQDDGTGTRRLTSKARERLAAAPFLLFTFREYDESLWRSLLDPGRQRDLLEVSAPASSELRALQAAGIAFLWELARRNPYALRVVSGAPLRWCEQIMSTTLVRVLEAVAHHTVIEARFDEQSSSYRRLLRQGGSTAREPRLFAQIGALQAMLTSAALIPYRRFPAAACGMPRAARQVADEV